MFTGAVALSLNPDQGHENDDLRRQLVDLRAKYNSTVTEKDRLMDEVEGHRARRADPYTFTHYIVCDHPDCKAAIGLQSEPSQMQVLCVGNVLGWKVRLKEPPTESKALCPEHSS